MTFRRNVRASKVQLAPLKPMNTFSPSTCESEDEKEEVKQELEVSKSFCFQLADGKKVTNRNIFEVLLGGDR